MKKILVVLVWLLGLALIAWICGRGDAPQAVVPAATTVAPAPAPAAAPPVAAAPAPTPAPKPSAAVVAAGNRIDDVLKSKVIEFGPGSATLTRIGRATLADIGLILKDNPALRFQVQGHTDSSGTDVANNALSQARATAVKETLASLGVGADRISAKGFGASVPVADNTTVEGRARNRRIAFSIEENK